MLRLPFIWTKANRPKGTVPDGGGGGGELGDNTISIIKTEDIARDWVRIELTLSAGGISAILPDPEQWVISGSVSGSKTVLETTNPRYSNGANLNIVYVKVDEEFVEGETITLSYTSTMDNAEMNGLQDQVDIAVTNNITSIEAVDYAGTDHFSGVDDDSIYSNKLVRLASGDRGFIDIGRGDNLLFVCNDDGDVHFSYCNFREAVLNVKIVGHPARVANLKNHEAYNVHFGFGVFATGNITIEDFEISDHQQGIQVKTVSDIPEPPYNLSRTDNQTISIKRGSIKNTSEEAMYVGADVAAPLIPIIWDVSDIDFIDIGRDAAQFRNGWGSLKRLNGYKDLRTWAAGNTDYEAELPSTINGHFIAFGTTTDGCLIEDCNCTDGVFGNGIFCNGYGEVIVRRCNIVSFGRTVEINNYNNHDEFATGQTTITFEGENSFQCLDVDPYSLDARRDAAEGKSLMTLNIGPDTVFLGSTYVEDMPEEPFGGGFRGGITVNYT